MANQTGTPEGSNTAVPSKNHDHDRVAMLSLRADGTPDQYDPEIIGDVEAAKAAAREQFKQQAVSARDTELRAELASDVVGYTVEDAPQDPTVEKLEKELGKTAEAGEKAADKAVKSLHNEA